MGRPWGTLLCLLLLAAIPAAPLPAPTATSAPDEPGPALSYPQEEATLNEMFREVEELMEDTQHKLRSAVEEVGAPRGPGKRRARDWGDWVAGGSRLGELAGVLGSAEGLGRAGGRFGVIWRQPRVTPTPTLSAFLPEDRNLSLCQGASSWTHPPAGGLPLPLL